MNKKKKKIAVKIVLFVVLVLLIIAVLSYFGIFKKSVLFSPGGMTIDDSGNYLITNCVQLQAMSENLSANYKLANNIDCSDTVNWNSGAGFAPVGTSTTPFTGNFNGNGYTITDLYISRSTTDYVGLFGSLRGNVSSVGLINTNLIGKNLVGSIAGYSLLARISNSYATGSISGISIVGGLVGSAYSSTNISNSYSTSNVIGSPAGGLTGSLNNAIISNSYSSGNVSGTTIGGLVGSLLTSTIANSYWYKRAQGLNCYRDSLGAGNSGCIAIGLGNESYFFNISNEPMKNWDFVNIWDNTNNLVGYQRLMRGEASLCGNAHCDSGETCSTCSADCGTCGGNNGGGGGGGGGGGSGGGIINTFSASESELAVGYKKELKIGDKINFVINTDSHSLTLGSIGSNFATISITSNPITLTLFVGEEKKINISSSDYYDLSVKLAGISGTKANVTIKGIYENINPIENNTITNETGAGGDLETPSSNKTLWIIVVIVLVIIIVLVVYFIKKKKDNYYGIGNFNNQN